LGGLSKPCSCDENGNGSDTKDHPGFDGLDAIERAKQKREEGAASGSAAAAQFVMSNVASGWGISVADPIPSSILLR
jgi:hypothetical protein